MRTRLETARKFAERAARELAANPARELAPEPRLYLCNLIRASDGAPSTAMARADDEAFSGDAGSGDASSGDEDSDSSAASDASGDSSWDDADDADEADADADAPAITQLDIEGDEDRSRLVTVGRGAQRHALRLTLAQRTSGSEFLVLDVDFMPPLHMPGLVAQSLVHFIAFSECAEVVPGLAHQRRVEEGAPRKRRGARAGRASTGAHASAGRASTGAPAGAGPPHRVPPQRVPVAILSECTFKVIRLGPLMLQIKTRKHFGALMTATAHVLLDQRLRFTADYSDVPRVPSPADAEHDALQATVAETLSARPGQRYQVALYCEGEPGCCEDTQPARKIARGRWQPDLPTEINFLRIAGNIYKKVAAQDRLLAARV